MSKKKLSSVQDIKEYFQQDESAYYFISATNFNLMSTADWVGRWFNVNFIDCYDGRNDSVIVPEYSETPVFKDIESIISFCWVISRLLSISKRTVRRAMPARRCSCFMTESWKNWLIH